MTPQFKVIAHRGVTTRAPGNTMAAFHAAVELGVDAVEFDVRLTRDGVPIVHHNWYIDESAAEPVPIYARSAAELRRETVVDARPELSRKHAIPTLAEVLDEFAAQLSLEIELKGPEPEAPARVASVLARYRQTWATFEITSFQPALLAAIRERCRGIQTALLYPPSEPWMHPDVVAYAALHSARLAGAPAVHLHPNQLNEQVAATVRAGGIEIHAHSINDEAALGLATSLGLPWICSDEPERALAYRRGLVSR